MVTLPRGSLLPLPRLALSVLASWLFVACANDRHDPYQVSRRDDAGLRSKLDRLQLLVSIVPRETAAGAADRAHGTNAADDTSAASGTGSAREQRAPEPGSAPARIRAVRLKVDGRDLGSFEVSGQDTKARLPGPVELVSEPGAVLVVAELGGDLDARGLDTVGKWVAAFQRRLETGSHVLELTGVTLEGASGKPVERTASAFLPFVAPDGAQAAYAGHAKLSFQGGAQP